MPTPTHPILSGFPTAFALGPPQHHVYDVLFDIRGLVWGGDTWIYNNGQIVNQVIGEQWLGGEWDAKIGPVRLFADIDQHIDHVSGQFAYAAPIKRIIQVGTGSARSNFVLHATMTLDPAPVTVRVSFDVQEMLGFGNTVGEPDIPFGPGSIQTIGSKSGGQPQIRHYRYLVGSAHVSVGGEAVDIDFTNNGASLGTVIGGTIIDAACRYGLGSIRVNNFGPTDAPGGRSFDTLGINWSRYEINNSRFQSVWTESDDGRTATLTGQFYESTWGPEIVYAGNGQYRAVEHQHLNPDAGLVMVTPRTTPGARPYNNSTSPQVIHGVSDDSLPTAYTCLSTRILTRLTARAQARRWPNAEPLANLPVVIRDQDTIVAARYGGRAIDPEGNPGFRAGQTNADGEFVTPLIFWPGDFVSAPQRGYAIFDKPAAMMAVSGVPDALAWDDKDAIADTLIRDFGPLLHMARRASLSVDNWSAGGWRAAALKKSQYPPLHPTQVFGTAAHLAVPPNRVDFPAAFDSGQEGKIALTAGASSLRVLVDAAAPDDTIFAVERDLSAFPALRHAFRQFRYLRLRVTASKSGTVRLVLLSQPAHSGTFLTLTFGLAGTPGYTLVERRLDDGGYVYPSPDNVSYGNVAYPDVICAAWDISLHEGGNSVVVDLAHPNAKDVYNSLGAAGASAPDPVGFPGAWEMNAGGWQADVFAHPENYLGPPQYLGDPGNDVPKRALSFAEARRVQRTRDPWVMRLEMLQAGGDYTFEEMTLTDEASAGHTPLRAAGAAFPEAVEFDPTDLSPIPAGQAAIAGGQTHMLRVLANGRPAVALPKVLPYTARIVQNGGFLAVKIIWPTVFDLAAAWVQLADDGAGVWTVTPQDGPSDVPGLAAKLYALYLQPASVSPTGFDLRAVVRSAYFLFDPGANITSPSLFGGDDTLTLRLDIGGVLDGLLAPAVNSQLDAGASVSLALPKSFSDPTLRPAISATPDADGYVQFPGLVNPSVTTYLYDGGGNLFHKTRHLLYELSVAGRKLGRYVAFERDSHWISLLAGLRRLGLWPSNLAIDTGEYFRVNKGESGLRVWRSAFAVPRLPSPGWAVEAVAVTRDASDTRPTLAVDFRARVLCLFQRGEADAWETHSDDDARTWSEAAMSIPGGKKPTVVSGTDHSTLRAAVVADGDKFRIKATIQHPGDAAPSALFTFSDRNGPLAVADDTFNVAHGYEGFDRWTLHVLMDGEQDTSDWWSADECRTWTRI